MNTNFVVNVVGTTAFAVTVPNGGESWQSGSSQTITWNNANTTDAPFSVPTVRILLSVDGGQTYPHVVSSSTDNDGTETLNLPSVAATTQARIKIEAIDNIFFDISNQNFTLTAPSGPTFILTGPATPVTASCPVPATLTTTISTSQSGGLTTPISLSATGNPAGTTVSFSPNPVTPGSNTTMTLNNANALPPGTYSITVNGVAGTVTSSTTVSFTISGGNPPAIATHPVNNTACVGGNGIFSVTVAGTGNTYQWQVSTDGGTTWSSVTGGTNNILNVNNVTAAMNNNIYRVVVSSSCGTATSNNATLTVTGNNQITTQPVSTGTCIGSSASFSVVASGANLAYQWQQSTTGCSGTFSNMAGQTSPTLNLTNVTAGMNGYAYRVIVSGSCGGSVTSSCVTLTISNSTSISAHPANTSACVGANASFSVTAAGNNLTYQWQLSTDGGATYSNISGATGSTYSVTATAAMNNNRYRVIANSTCGSTNSNAAILTVNNPPAITTQPGNQSSCVGGNANFLSQATGAGLSYQWQVSTDGGTTWNNVSGGTNPGLTLTGITASMNNNRYRVVVNSTCGSVTSSAGIFTIVSPVAITTQPQSANSCTGATANFSVAATGGNLTYQWQVSTAGCSGTFTNIAGENSATLNLTNITAGMNGNGYRVIVSGSCGTPVTSTCATLSINNSITITTQPSNVSVCEGNSANFTAAANGAGLTYQWQVSTDGGTNYTNIAGATSATYSIASTTAAQNNNRIRVLVSGTCNPNGVTSNAATLTVTTAVSIASNPANFTGCVAKNAWFFATANSNNGHSYQWQVSTNGGNTFTNIAGATSDTLRLNNLTAAMSGNIYRLVATGTSCGTATSQNATLTVIDAPAVSISSSGTAVIPGDSVQLSAVVEPGSPNYTYLWYYNTNPLSTGTNNSIWVNFAGVGSYSVVAVNPLNGCTAQSSIVAVTERPSELLFIYPNPNNGVFNVMYYDASATAKRTINIFDGKGSRVYSKEFTSTAGYTRMVVDIRKYPSGIYIVDVRDKDGKALAVGKVKTQP